MMGHDGAANAKGRSGCRTRRSARTPIETSRPSGTPFAPSGTRAFARALARALAHALAVSVAAGIVVAPTAHAVLIKLGDGTGNTNPRADVTGMDHVGSVLFQTGVYLGNGWVITANHIEIGPFVLGGQTYPDVPGSRTRLTTPGVGPADLALFKIDGDPGLPAIDIATLPVGVNASVVLFGHGRNRGDAVTWPDPGGEDGWQWGTGHTLRWGTNRVAAVDQTAVDTRMFFTAFDESGPGVGADEAQAIIGDSGGAVFYERAGSWELTGIMFAVGKNAVEQPDNFVLFGNLTLAADLSVYRSEILSIISQPTCNDGLDEDGDGLVDYPADPGCDSVSDSDERDPKLVCDDGVDQDGDGLVDWPADPGCTDSIDDSEQAENLICDDGVDNEGDGLIDHAQDPGCGADPRAPSEGPPPVPVSMGLGTSALVAIVGWVGHRRALQSGR